MFLNFGGRLAQFSSPRAQWCPSIKITCIRAHTRAFVRSCEHACVWFVYSKWNFDGLHETADDLAWIRTSKDNPDKLWLRVKDVVT